MVAGLETADLLEFLTDDALHLILSGFQNANLTREVRSVIDLTGFSRILTIE